MKVIPKDIKAKFSIENWAWVSTLIGQEGSLTIAFEKISDEFSSLTEFIKQKQKIWNENPEEGDKANSDIKWASYRKTTLKTRDVIGFLASNGVIPKYGFPTDVVNLEILSNIQASKNVRLERDLRLAISEFAPGSQIIANGNIWESCGLRLVRNKTWPIYCYGICPVCGQFIMKKITIDNKKVELECPKHGRINRVYKFVIPEFGFVTQRKLKNKKPGISRPKKEYTTRPYFYDYKDKPIVKEFSFNRLRIICEYSDQGELAVICKGKKGTGFTICFECGRAFPGFPKNLNHDNPYGSKCRNSNMRQGLHLGHSFKTDVVAIEIEGTYPDDNSFWYSLLYTLLEGASLGLSIKRRDLDGCLHNTGNGKKLILFDNVPGGAGHVKRLMNESDLYCAINTGINKLKNCDCGYDTSCYGCLRNYQNQYFHDILNRGMVLDYLKNKF